VAQLDLAARKNRRKRRNSMQGTRPTHRATKSIFADDIDEEDLAAEAAPDADDHKHDVQLAAPGDMQLSVEIGRLAGKIAELDQQAAILESLICQAELTGNKTELKLLHRSLSSLLREKRTAEFQKAQYEQQEEENRLMPGRTSVSIPSTLITPGDHEGGRQIVRYNVEIRQVGDDGRIHLTWVVTHRYNEFYELDRALREWAASVNHPQVSEDLKSVVDLPGKRLVPNLSSYFVESRRAGLERYLQVGNKLSDRNVTDPPSRCLFREVCATARYCAPSCQSPQYRLVYPCPRARSTRSRRRIS
jgi:sorting nexin-25